MNARGVFHGGEVMIQTRLLTGVLAAQVLFLPVQAFALRGDSTLSSFRQETRTQTIEVRGALSCLRGASNNGEACALKIQDQKSGRIFNLANASEVMRIFNEGNQFVTIEGKMSGDSTLVVSRVQIL
jgi:hypothetical protein